MDSGVYYNQEDAQRSQGLRCFIGLFPSLCSSYYSIPSDVLEVVYSVGAHTAIGWNYLLEQYGLSMSGAEKKKILYALSTSQHQEKLKK